MPNSVDPRHHIWLETASFLEATYLSKNRSINPTSLAQSAPSIKVETLQKLLERIKASDDLSKADRMVLIMLKLLKDEPARNGKEALHQVQTHLNEVELTFVPWSIVLENQTRNHHEDETDPLILANLYRHDATQQAIQDVKAGIPPQQRDPFYRGVMKPPSETAVRRNVFPGKAIYGLTSHLIVVDEHNGSIQIQRVGKPYDSTLTGLWFDLAYFQTLPQRPYEFQKPGVDGKKVWDYYEFNDQATLDSKKS